MMCRPLTGIRLGAAAARLSPQAEDASRAKAARAATRARTPLRERSPGTRQVSVPRGLILGLTALTMPAQVGPPRAPDGGHVPRRQAWQPLERSPTGGRGPP